MDLLKRINDLREAGDFVESLKLADDALIEFADDPSRFAETLLTRVLVFRHLFEKTQSKNFAKLAKFEAKAAIKVLEMNNNEDGMAIAFYTLAKTYDSLGKFEKEKEAIEEAITKAADDKSFTAEMRTRLTAVEYRLGDESAAERFAKALEDLKQNPHIDEYTHNVWLSGAYMHMAEACMTRGEKDKAMEQFKLAEEIIKGDERLKLRQNQLEKLRRSL